MHIGMLWFDNNPKKTLMDKVNSAAAYYQNKYGVVPNAAFIHPSMLDPDKFPIEYFGVKVEVDRHVLPNHIWIGFNADSRT